MANWLTSKDQFQIHIPSFKSDNYYAEFYITVHCLNRVEWRIYRRYSEFKKLFDELIKIDDKYKVYFPPKKSFNNMSTYFLNSRRKSLEMYLNEIISKCNQNLPRSLAYFLEMDKYEIHGITTAMAKTLFKHGTCLLTQNCTFEISVLHIHSINQRMSSPAPTNLYQKYDEDFGNVLDFVESLKRVKIVSTSVPVCSMDNCFGTSNIKLSSLTFDLSIFASVTDLQLDSVEISNLRGLYKMNNTIERLRVRYCLKSIKDLLLADFAYQESSIDHLHKFDGPLRCATDVDFSHNSLVSIDTSIVTLRQLQSLNLAHNHISDIDHLHYLIYLTELDLSYNNLSSSQWHSLSNKVGSLKTLTLRGNKLTSLMIVDRMFALEYLDVSDNLLADDLSLLSLCRLSCLESLCIKDNPICSQSHFILLIFDLFLDRYQNIKINDIHFVDLPPNVRMDIEEYRAAMKKNVLSESHIEQDSNRSPRNKLSAVTFYSDQYEHTEHIGPDTILSNTNIFNIFIYWFYLAMGKFVNPQKFLWVTEIFAPNRSVRPLSVLLVTSGTNLPNVLKCRLTTSTDTSTKRQVVTIQPKHFMELSGNCQHIIIGADRSFLRLDLSPNNRNIYLCNNPSTVDAFICHLYHVDEGMASYGDSRIVYLNEEDRMEMMRRFVDVWRLDMVATMKRNGENIDIGVDCESEFLFTSRAMLQMKNGFQILLTVVVTKEVLYLVDERIYDWPDFNKHPNLSGLSSGNSCSPYTSSCGQFPFLRTNGFLLCHIDICSDGPSTNLDQCSLIDSLCPVFKYSVQITFTSYNQSIKDPLKLLFENEQKTAQLCRVINQRCDTVRPSVVSFPNNICQSAPKSLQSDTPCLLRHFQSSYSEIRLCLTLCHPQLLQLAQLSVEQILPRYQDLVGLTRDIKILGIIWTKFIHIDFDATTRRHETPGLVCVASSGIFVLYEVEDDSVGDRECASDPEVDQPDNSNAVTRLQSVCVSMKDMFKIYVGLNYQWLTVSYREDCSKSESGRLVLVVRNKDLCKHLITWINTAIGDPSDQSMVEHGHQSSDIKELTYQIQRSNPCGDIEVVHYCSLEDVRFDPSMSSEPLSNSCDAVFSRAVVVTTMNIAIIRHNIGEYPVRVFAAGTVRESPRHLQYQVLAVVPLFDCLQLQLPGHDRSILIIVIKSNDCHASTITTTHKLQLSITSQTEQKRLIDKLRQQRSKCLQIDTPLRVSVC